MDDIEFWNSLSALNYSRRKQTPAKTWWEADAEHAAIARAMRIDRTQEGGVFALAPFRLWHDGERHLILAAYPTPRILGPVDGCWLGIEAVLAWNPLDDTARVLGDTGAQLVGQLSNEAGTVFASPREFFTQWAIDRAAFFVRWCEARRGAWTHGANEADLAPGKLAIGKPEQIRWTGLPQSIELRGLDARQINTLILRQASLPRAHNSRERMAA